MEGDDSATLLMVALWYFTLALMYGSLIYMVISEVVACFRRWRSRRDAKLAAERLLDSVPDAPYHPLPDHAAADDDEEGGGGGLSSCVICIEEYERGERCFVMPPCAHMFHRGCIAGWLRQGNNTCPICRATVSPVPPQRCISCTAEDMV